MCLNKFKKTGVLLNIFSNHDSSMKLEINKRKNFGKKFKYTEIKQHAYGQVIKQTNKKQKPQPGAHRD